MNFDQCLAPVIKREGGYSNHAADRGGATNMGITQRTYSAWRAERGLGYVDVRGLDHAEARQIYLENYWKPARCDDLPAEIRDIHFDTAVNSGVARAAKMLQESARVEQDGQIGPVTLAAVSAMAPDLLRARYIAARYKFYGEIIARDRSQLAFIVGWLNRMKEFN